MRENQLLKGTIIRTIFVFVELIALIVISIITFSNDGTSAWGYWGAVAVVFITLSPIFIYVIASTVFNIFNLTMVIKNKHTTDTIKKYHRLSKAYFIWGIITGCLYGFILPIFLLENIFLFNAYRKELKISENTSLRLQAQRPAPERQRSSASPSSPRGKYIQVYQ